MSANVYLITGESFLASEALDRIREETSADPIDEVSFDGKAPIDEIMEALQTASLFGGRRLVLIRNAHELKKEHTDPLSAWIADPADHAILVLIGEGGRVKLAPDVKKNGTVIALEAPKGRRLISWIRQRGTEHGLKLDERGAWALLDAVGPLLRDLDAALQQLLVQYGPGSRAGANEVRSAFPRLADERIFVLTDAIGERRTAVVMGTLRRLLEQGDEPLVLFGSVVAHVRRMLIAHRYADAGPKALGDALGMPDWRAKRLYEQAQSYREDELVAALTILSETDLEMKGGDMPPDLALERAVIRIVGAPTHA